MEGRQMDIVKGIYGDPRWAYSGPQTQTMVGTKF